MVGDTTPSAVILPWSGSYSPASNLIKVDLPAPFSPTIATSSPGWIFLVCDPYQQVRVWCRMMLAKTWGRPASRAAGSALLSPDVYV